MVLGSGKQVRPPELEVLESLQQEIVLALYEFVRYRQRGHLLESLR